MPTLLFSETHKNEIIRIAAENMGLASHDIEACKTFIASATNIAKPSNWEVMSISTAQGGSNAGITSYIDVGFDGRYVYFTPDTGKTFIRFDTTQLFSNSSAWEKMSVSTANGTSVYPSYQGCCFDGRYMYYSSFSGTSFIRFDTTQAFTTAGAWEKVNASSIYGNNADPCHARPIFDGRYIYYAPASADTFLRYDTTLTYNLTTSWEKISMSTAQGAAALDNAYAGVAFDGRYVYYSAYQADTFIRFDTTLAFTNSAAFIKMSVSTALGASFAEESLYWGGCFDGRYVYYGVFNALTFVRFDSTISFTNSSAWEKISVSTARGSSGSDQAGECSFDGRYIYYGSYGGNTIMRFDSTKSFVNSSAWETMSKSTILGTSSVGTWWGTVCDGKYIYFCPYASLTFIRVAAMNSNLGTMGRK